MEAKNVNLFRKIIMKEIPAEIIWEDEDVIAIMDINPFNKGHFLVIPKNHSHNLKDIKTNDLVTLMERAVFIANSRRNLGYFDDFKLIVNNGENAGQEVFHTHVHIIPFYTTQ